MKKLHVQKVGVGSLAKVFGITNAAIMIVYGLVTTVLVASGQINEGTSFVKALAINVVVLGLGIIIFPLIGYFLGWIQGALVALVMNFVFKESGGLELEVEDKK